jgi:hypothetical protein
MIRLAGERACSAQRGHDGPTRATSKIRWINVPLLQVHRMLPP